MNDLENYTKEKLTINLVWANIFGLLILIPIIAIYGIPYYLIWGEPFQEVHFADLFHAVIDTFFDSSLVVVAYVFGGIILHELIHGFFWALFTKNGFKSIRFGVMWKMLTPYCHCKEPLRIKHYIIGAIMPAILLGLVPALVGIYLGNMGWVIFGAFFTMAAAGDFLIIYLLKNERMDNLVEDHPTEAGCFIFREDDGSAA